MQPRVWVLLLAFGAWLPAQDPPACCDAAYRFGFSQEFIRSAVPGEGIFDASSTCAASGATVKGNKPFSIFMNIISDAPSADDAVQGFSTSIEVTGGVVIFDGALVGLSDFFGGAGGSAHFARIDIVDPGQNGGRRGAVAAVVFPEALVGRAGPPHVGTESLLELTVDRLAPAEPNAEGRVFFADGLKGAGQPVLNAISARGATVFACNGTSADVAVVFAPDAPFRRGDPNDDGKTDISDAVFIFGYLFLGSREPSCMRSADANADGRLDISDPSFILNFLFYGSSAPPDPGPPPRPCSPGEEGAPLSCADYLACP